MRTKLFFPLFLAALFGCDGRYDLGTQRAADGGTGGTGSSDNGGQAANSGMSASGVSGNGDTNQGGSAAGASADGGAGAGGSSAGASGSAGTSGSAGAGGSPVITGRSPWLMSTSFVSSSSTVTAISLLNLADPTAQPITLGGNSPHLEPNDGDGFSPNGRWVSYRSYNGQDYELYVAAVGANAATPVHIGTTAPQNPCRWSPDSTRIACILGTTADRANSQLVFFSTSGDGIGPSESIGHGERDLAFVDAETLVYGSSSDDFSRLTWQNGTPSAPEPLHIGGGLIVQRSPDGKRALLKATDTGGVSGTTTGVTLVDFTTGANRALNPKLALSLSRSFASAFAVTPDPAGAPNSTDYLYYSIDDVDVSEVGSDLMEAPPRGTNPSSQLFDRTLVRMRGEQLLVVDIGAAGVTEHIVAGDYQNVNDFALDPTGQYLYFGTWTYDQTRGEPDETTGELWLSHLGSAGPDAAQRIGTGVAGMTGAFSPDGHFLLVAPLDDTYPSALPFNLFDLSSSPLKPYTLGIPFNWAFVNWSPDSTRVSFIGGAPATKARSEYVVDTLALSAAPRLIMTCAPPGGASATCAGSADFQP